jgi:hypothetical protein
VTNKKPNKARLLIITLNTKTSFDIFLHFLENQTETEIINKKKSREEKKLTLHRSDASLGQRAQQESG